MGGKWVPSIQDLSNGKEGSQTVDNLGEKSLVSDLIIHSDLGPKWNQMLVNNLWDRNVAKQMLSIALGGSDIRS